MSLRSVFCPMALLASLLLSACATTASDLRSHLAGRTIRSVDSKGEVFVHYLGKDGKVHTLAGPSQLAGHWFVVGRELCFQWVFTPTRPEDCWRFDQTPAKDRVVTARNRAGASVSATLL